MRLFSRILGISIVVLGLGYYSLFVYELGLYSGETQLEIYTYDNIYYINGLVITNEANDTVITFSNIQGVNDYIYDKLQCEIAD